MANSKSKLLPTQNLFSAFLMIFIFSLLLITSVKSDSLSFSFPTFEPGVRNIVVDGDANTTGGILQLTNKGPVTQHSVGLAGFFGAVHISDKSRGRNAEFATEFSFIVNPLGSRSHGDGFTFFIASIDFDFPDNSSGGFLGLFNEKTAFNISKNQIVAVEFDSFRNDWDPIFANSPDQSHIGININTIRSVETTPWPLDISQGATGLARILYDDASKLLSVSVSYPSNIVEWEATISYPIDFVSLLSEWVLVGFSGSTGDLVETHDILSWSFSSFL
ncbi:lectin 5-like [Gastrolobium bilobum]|uniref:lectin 5-like n=1 Tax=Gastrolobium bilobum TaxID=150636 RepID=UPI002AB29DB6|nr:lectin 5-like [Gastrolobium bilobum]